MSLSLFLLRQVTIIPPQNKIIVNFWYDPTFPSWRHCRAFSGVTPQLSIKHGLRSTCQDNALYRLLNPPPLPTTLHQTPTTWRVYIAQSNMFCIELIDLILCHRKLNRSWYQTNYIKIISNNSFSNHKYLLCDDHVNQIGTTTNNATGIGMQETWRKGMKALSAHLRKGNAAHTTVAFE